jgi:hypothetical protein
VFNQSLAPSSSGAFTLRDGTEDFEQPLRNSGQNSKNRGKVNKSNEADKIEADIDQLTNRILT